MKRNSKIQTMVIAGLLCAVGIIIPTFSPIKIVLEPASFTLASHVAVFIAMFISPVVAVSVALGTTLGFLLGGFPIVVVMRALTHVVFCFIGATYLSKHGDEMLHSVKSSLPFSFVIGVIHGLCEVAIVLPFYLSGQLSEVNYQKGFFVSIIVLVGVGSVIHSIVDFGISVMLWQPLRKSLHMPIQNPQKQLAE